MSAWRLHEVKIPLRLMGAGGVCEPDSREVKKATKELNETLEEGWEPFAVLEDTYSKTYCFRRQKD